MRFLIAGTLLSLAALSSCRKEMASWESNWTLPLVNDTLDLKNLVTDSFLSLDGSGFYQLEINRNILDIKMSDYIEIPDTVVSQKYAIGASLNVSPGTSFVNNNKDHNFDLQGAQLKRAHISAGKIKISVENPIETKTIFTVKLPKAKKNGVQISQTFQAPAGTNQNPSVTSAVIDLSDYDLDLTGTNGEGYNLLQSQMTVQSDPAGDAVTVNNYDTTKFIIEMEGLKLNYARGYFGNLVVEDTSTLHVDFLDKVTSGVFDLPNTDIEFIISNGIKVNAKATLNSLVNTNSHTGNSVALSHPQIGVPMYIEQATGTWDAFFASVKNLSFTSNNSNVEQYIENLGANQKLNFRLELNPQGNLSGGWDEFFPESRLQVRMKAHMPLSASMTALTIQDTFELDLDKNTDKTHIVAGKLKLSTANAFPMQGTVQIYLLDESGQLVETVTGSEAIASSLAGPVISGQLRKSNSTVYFDLSESTLGKIDIIRKAVVKVVLNTPGPGSSNSEFVMIPEGAYMAVKLGTAFQLETRF